MMRENQRKIMVVEDNEGIRYILEGIIEDEGYTVVTAENGYQAIELAKDTPFSLIFIDVKMPGIDGVQTYREIKKNSPGSVVVMMTGFSVQHLIKEALEEGAYAVIYKPFAVEQIIETVRAVLQAAFVLVVDDRAVDRETLRSVLEESGYQVTTAEDGNQAIALVLERHYDAILMDIRMPGMDGITAFEKIRKVAPHVKVIFITGYELENSIREALLSGAYNVLIKPVIPEEMLALLSSIAGRGATPKEPVDIL